MAWVDHDDRAIVRRSCRFGRLSRCDQRVGIGKGRPQFGPRFLCQRLHESRAVDLGQLQHQPRRLPVGGFKHVGIGDLRRACEIKHNP